MFLLIQTYKNFQDANVMPTENLLAATEKAHPGLKRFVFVSSLASYGPSPVGKPLDESSPRRPVEFYGKSKLEAEEAVERRAGKVAYTIVRPSGVYGPGDVDYFNLFREAAKGRNLFFGNRDKWASVIYVDDLVELILLAATAKAAEGKGYFGSDEAPITWGDFQSHIVEATGKRPLTLNLPGLTVDVAAFFGELVTKVDGKPRLFNKQKAIMAAQQAWTCTSAAAKNDLGFEPKVLPREGCVRALGWYRDQKWM